MYVFLKAQSYKLESPQAIYVPKPSLEQGLNFPSSHMRSQILK